MKLQSVKRIIKESLPQEFRPIVDVVGYSFNTFAEDVINAFNKKITVDDNLNMEYKEISIQVDSQGKPINPVTFRTVVTGRIRGVIVVRVEDLSANPEAPLAAPFATCSYNTNLITIENVRGLKANVNYNLTVLVLG